jgi:hypothetical protein
MLANLAEAQRAILDVDLELLGRATARSPAHVREVDLREVHHAVAIPAGGMAASIAAAAHREAPLAFTQAAGSARPSTPRA